MTVVVAQLVERSLPLPGPRFESSHQQGFIFILNKKNIKHISLANVAFLCFEEIKITK